MTEDFIAKRNNEYAAMSDEAARVANERMKRIEMMHPPIRTIFGRLDKCPHIKKRIAERLQIISELLSIEALDIKAEPTLETALMIFGRQRAISIFVEEIRNLLSDALNTSFIMAKIPRELFNLMELCKEQSSLADKLVKAICFQKLKESKDEPKTKADRGETLLPKDQTSMA